jgi:hypothetical protein
VDISRAVRTNSSSRRTLARSRAGSLHGTFLVHEVALVEGIQYLHQANHAPEKAAADIEDITPLRGLAAGVEREAPLPEEPLDQSAL